MDNKIPFKRFGTMIDCSRNAVMTTKSLKKWIDITSDLGYTSLLLYIEDTYEVDENPYFGYFRGRYSQTELKEVNDYALSKGMELIPCIQTLAHVNAITRWPAYGPLIDTGDILLAGDDRVYDLIDKMFASLAKSFTTRTVNIGMDEAHMIGRGQYYDIHGDSDRTKILTEHIKKVAAIGKKYGFTLAMWSDMFFRLVAGDYYNSGAEIDEEVKKQIPDNVQLIYWDYYSTSKKHYDQMFDAHAKIKDGTWFAGGLWSWIGFAPHNDYSMKATRSAMQSCREHNIQDVFLTMWGDDGGECSKFALLPSLFYASEVAKGNYSKPDIKVKFQQKYGISFDSFMSLDLLGLNNGKTEVFNTEKYMLYNDCFMGITDSVLSGDEGAKFAKCARKLARMKNNPEWGYLFASEQALCEALTIKADLGLRTRAAYANGKDELLALLPDYKKLSKKLKVFYNAYRTQWYTENKPQGFDVQDIRLGGLMTRIDNCAFRIEQYCDGKIDKLEEMDEKNLDLFGGGDEFLTRQMCYQSWKLTVTANVL